MNMKSYIGFLEPADPTNVAESKPASQSSTYGTWVASKAVDNDVSTVSCTHHIYSHEPWWAVDLEEPMDVAKVNVTNDHHQTYG